MGGGFRAAAAVARPGQRQDRRAPLRDRARRGDRHTGCAAALLPVGAAGLTRAGPRSAHRWPGTARHGRAAHLVGARCPGGRADGGAVGRGPARRRATRCVGAVPGRAGRVRRRPRPARQGAARHHRRTRVLAARAVRSGLSPADQAPGRHAAGVPGRAGRPARSGRRGPHPAHRPGRRCRPGRAGRRRRRRGRPHAARVAGRADRRPGDRRRPAAVRATGPRGRRVARQRGRGKPGAHGVPAAHARPGLAGRRRLAAGTPGAAVGRPERAGARRPGLARRRGVLRRWIAEPQEHLLADLGRASRCCRCSTQRCPRPTRSALHLDVAGAYDFLGKAATLDQAGFGVLLPELAAPRRADVDAEHAWHGHARAPWPPPATGWASSAGVLPLAAGPGRRVADRGRAGRTGRGEGAHGAVRGQWVQVDRRSSPQGLRSCSTPASGQMPIRARTAACRARGVRAARELDRRCRWPTSAARAGSATCCPASTTSASTPSTRPRSFAADAAAVPAARARRGSRSSTELGLGACLADDMGLGKTVQLLALEALRRRRDRPCADAARVPDVGGRQLAARGRAVHPAPARARAPRRRAGSVAPRSPTPSRRADLVVTTYACSPATWTSWPRCAWDRVVLDEAQNIKNSGPRQSHALRGNPGRHRIALTGTPVENRLGRAVVHLGLRQPGPARLAVDVPGPVRRAGRAPRRRGRRGPAAQGDRPVRVAPAQDRPGR